MAYFYVRCDIKKRKRREKNNTKKAKKIVHRRGRTHVGNFADLPATAPLSRPHTHTDASRNRFFEVLDMKNASYVVGILAKVVELVLPQLLVKI